jgi:hypothetical protein
MIGSSRQDSLAGLRQSPPSPQCLPPASGFFWYSFLVGLEQQHIERFNDLILPFCTLWSSVTLVAFAVLVDDKWISLGTRFELSEEPPGKDISLRVLPQFVALKRSYLFEKFGNLLNSVVSNGYVQVGSGDKPWKIYLSKRHANPTAGTPDFGWFPPRQNPPLDCFAQFGIDRTCIALTAQNPAERIYDVAPIDLLEQVDSKIRLCDPPFEDLKALVAYLAPKLPLDGNTNLALQILAPLPFRLVQDAKAGLVVHAPQKAMNEKLQLMLFFEPQGNPAALSFPEEECAKSSGARQIEWVQAINWPEGSVRAKCFLYYSGENVLELQADRWPKASSLRVAVENYFDPEHTNLKELLFKRNDSRRFEYAVVRLMNLLDIPLIWYDPGSKGSRPDAAGIVFLSEATKPIVLLVECSVEKPQAKFSALAGRAAEIGKHLQGEAEINPVVFTRSSAGEGDAGASREYGIALVGETELQSLVQMLEARSQAEDVIAFLTSLRLAPRFGPWGSRPWG